MKQFFVIFCLAALVTTGCTAVKADEPYSPSIAALKSNEMLIATILQCHRSCSTATLEFRNGNVRLIAPELDLSSKEIPDLTFRLEGKVMVTDPSELSETITLRLTAEEIKFLDGYFLSGDNPDYSCSNVVKIMFEHRSEGSILNTKDFQIYPCSQGGDKVSPTRIWYHLEDIQSEIPYWRMSSEDRHEMMIQRWEKNKRE